MMAAPSQKQILLFLAAVVVPSMALTFLTLQIISQEKELAAKRLQEERSRRAREIGQILLARLETIKRDEVQQQIQCDAVTPCAYIHPETRLIAVKRDGRLALPWELGPVHPPIAASEPAVAELIRKAEAAEFVAKDSIKSVEAYRAALSSTPSRRRRELIRLELARVLRKAGRIQEAGRTYREIAALSADFKDEDGMPLCLYAADALLDQGEDGREILPILEGIMTSPGWQQPLVYYRLCDLAKKVLARPTASGVHHATDKILANVRQRIQDIEAATELQRNADSMEIFKHPDGASEDLPKWKLINAARWFVGTARKPVEDVTFVVAVGAGSLLQELRRTPGVSEINSGAWRFVDGSDMEGDALGSAFPDSRIALEKPGSSPEANSGNDRRFLYGLTLLLVLGITLFGGYLLWRDVRREVRLASLRSQFVAGVSHELKTPLASIRMFADTLRLGRLKSQKTQEEYLNTIVNESERLSRLLSNVLDFSRIEEGQMAYQFAPVSVPDVVVAAAKAMSYPLEQMGFTLAIALEDGLPEIQADRDALIQALINLLHNAMKFSGSSRRIELSAARIEDSITIRIADQGIGIDAAEHKKIFERFYRASSSNPERIPGTGLGLTIVSHIVNAHRGAVQVESAPGCGSTFSITLPLGSQS
jgi:signal transduction histidine kinase